MCTLVCVGPHVVTDNTHMHKHVLKKQVMPSRQQDIIFIELSSLDSINRPWGGGLGVKTVLCFLLTLYPTFSEQTSQSLRLQSTLDQFIPYKGWKLYFSEGRVKELKSTKSCISISGYYISCYHDSAGCLITYLLLSQTSVRSVVFIHVSGKQTGECLKELDVYVEDSKNRKGTLR